MRTFEDFVPDPGVLQSASGLDGVVRLVMLGVSGRAVVRTSFQDDAEVSEAVFSRLLEAKPRAPDFDAFAERNFPELDEASRDAQLTTCLTCAVTPGTQKCRACGGRGRIYITKERSESCTCSGGRVPCSDCDGTKQSYSVRLHYHREKVRTFAHVFVPRVIPGLHRALVRFMQTRQDIPDCLEIELTEDYARRDAYRGRAGEEEYRGHRIAGVLHLARRYVSRIEARPSVRALRYRTIAWPFALHEDVPNRAAVVGELGSALLLKAD